MLDKEVVKKIFSIIKIEYSEFVPTLDNDLKNKLDLWHGGLKGYHEDEVIKAVKEVLHHHVYGVPKLAHIVEAIERERSKAGVIFKKRLKELIRKKGVYHMEDDIQKEFGEIGVNIYNANYHELSMITYDNEDKVLNRISEVYNGLVRLEDDRLRALEVAKNKNQIGTSDFNESY